MKARTDDDGRRYYASDCGDGVHFCYGVDIRGVWMTWRMDEGHHAYTTVVEFDTETGARFHLANRIRFYRHMVRVGQVSK